VDKFTLWQSNDNAKPDVIRKRFNRTRNWFHEYDYISE
jgi:hypothetical protein